MPLPLLNYAPVSQNPRVAGYEIPGDEQPTIFTTENILSSSDMDNLIEAAYSQLYFHAFKSDREPFLESQLRNGQITVRDFIRGLLLAPTFIDSFYNKNSNYRFVEQCVQRVLGRDVYSEREKIAWSIVVAQQGYKGFINALLDTDEYLDNFGYNIVPFQRRRILPGRPVGELPFNLKSPRYDYYYRNILGFPKFVPIPLSRKKTKVKITKGSPSAFLDLARSISPQPVVPMVPSVTDLDYLTKVPRRI